MEPLNVLLLCEESQEVAGAFRELGHRAFSCDLQDCSGGNPDWHIKNDAFQVLGSARFYTQDAKLHHIHNWDLTISFQPCTDLTVSGARWFEQKRLSGEQEQSIRFFFNIWKQSDCSENPIGILNGGAYVKKWFPELYDEMLFAGFPFRPSQIIQPWQFGHGETKATCLWLKGLPKLKPTNIVAGREQRVWKLPPSEDRQKLRSKTYSGIAKAIADQWSAYVLSGIHTPLIPF